MSAIFSTLFHRLMQFLEKMYSVFIKQIKFVADYPVGMFGINTITRFTVLNEGISKVPRLLSVDVLRDFDADIKL